MTLLIVSKSFLFFLDSERASEEGSEGGSGGSEGGIEGNEGGIGETDGRMVGAFPCRPGAMLPLQRIDR